MKTETFLIVAMILVLAGITGMAAFNTHIGYQEEQIANQQAEIDQAEAWRYWTEIAAQPPPYQQPLEQLWISSGTGYRMDPMGGGTESLHKGKDFAGVTGTPVKAVLDGVVAEHWLVPGWHYGKEYHGHPIMGGYIVIDHGDGLFSLYGHLSATFVHEDNWIEAGQVIGEVGNTGISTGPHLHFELVVDPLRYLEER